MIFLVRKIFSESLVAAIGGVKMASAEEFDGVKWKIRIQRGSR